MESRAKMFGHPIHPMLIVFPLGLLSMAAIFDVLYLLRDEERWAHGARWLIASGLLGGVAAAVFGVIDWLAIPRGTRAREVGLWHGLGNAVVLALFAASWFLRSETPTQPPVTAIVLGLVGVGISVVTGWLGGELVDRLGVGVDDGANLNAPNSLSGRPAGGAPGGARVEAGSRP